MTKIFPIEEIEPIAGDSVATAHYVACDYCLETVMQDIWAKRPERLFYRAQDDGLIVCENCLPTYFSEDTPC